MTIRNFNKNMINQEQIKLKKTKFTKFVKFVEYKSLSKIGGGGGCLNCLPPMHMSSLWSGMILSYLHNLENFILSLQIY